MAIYLGNQKINVKSNAHEISDDSLKLFFEAGGNCCESIATSFVDVIPYNATSNLTSMYQFFYDSQNLKEVGLLDTAKVTDMSSMFEGCSSLITVPQFDTSKVTDMGYMFYDCSAITEIHMKNMSVSFDLHHCIKMGREALLEVINNLATVTSTRTLTMGLTLKAKLTDDDIAIATAKGWTIA